MGKNYQASCASKNMEPVNTWILILTLLVSLGLIPVTGYAAGAAKAVIHGKVFSVPCKVNGQQALDFDFQRVGIRRIDGARYAVTQKFPVECDKDLNARLLLKVSGVEINGTLNHVLKTDVNNLGIALFDGVKNKELPLNTEVEVDTSRTFTIRAVPVKEDTSKTLDAKPFRVTATVIAYYE